MRLSAQRAAWMVALACSAAGFTRAADDHGSGVKGAWWETEACCHQWPLADPEGKVRAAYDEASGRSLLNYPPHRFADHLHMKLEVRIADMNTPRLDATETLTMVPIGMELPEVTLDCGPSPSMEITGVQLGNQAGIGGARRVTYTHEGEDLRISIDPPVPVGERFDVVIMYTLTDPPEGLTWTPESPAWPGRPAQLHTQGQPQSNHYWFPCHDFPNERLTTEVIATVPEGYTVVSNGKLVEKASEGAGKETFHWLQAKDHVNYLVTLVVGKFDVVDVGNSKLAMPVYAPLGQGRNVEQSYGRTKDMIRKFESILDEPFPWDKYAQVIVHNFAAGGMENSSATTMYDTALLDKTALLDGDLDGLISHELAHQWFGDLMTCNSWEHIWLNEGFATYFSHIWFEERDGKEAYLSGMYGTFRGVAANDTAEAPYRPGMCSKEYSHPWEAFRRGSNPYPKGAAILHMLRVQLGDNLFREGLRRYVDRVKGKTVETDDLRYAFEDVSGLSLDRFIRQWCYRPGVPHVEVKLDWDSAASKLKIDLKQTQNIDGYNPAFFFSLPIWVQCKGGPREGEWLEMAMDAKEATKTFDLRGEPTIVAVNANLALLADISVEQPEERWHTQLDQGPTIAARMQALDALHAIAKSKEGPLGPEVANAVAALVRNTQTFHALRSAAADALADIAGPEAFLKVMRQLPDDARVREVLVRSTPSVYKSIAARADSTPARLIDDLRQLAKRDPSYGVRSAAISSLGHIGGPGVKPLIVDALGVESQHDQIRRAALGALAEFDDAEGLDLVLRYTAPGITARTRPEAVDAVAKLSHHNTEKAVDALVVLLNDREARTARSAGEALVTIGGPKATQAIDAYAAGARGAIAKATAADWVKRMKDKTGRADAGR